MAIAFDAYASNTTNGTGNFSWTHTPVGTPKGAIVYVLCNGSGADEITSVTYGGTAMTQITSSPVLNTTGELGSAHGFFLGSSVPTGAQTVSVTTSGTATTKIGGSVTVTASNDTSVVTQGTVSSNSQANPSTTLSLGGVSCFCMFGAWSGIGNLSQTPFANWTERTAFDFGNQNGFIHTYNTIGTADVSAGYTAGADDVALHAVAIRESAGGSTTYPVNMCLMGIG